MLTTSRDLEEMEMLCRQHLPKFQCPRNFMHVEHLPLTATGKPARAEAVRMASEADI